MGQEGRPGETAGVEHLQRDSVKRCLCGLSKSCFTLVLNVWSGLCPLCVPFTVLGDQGQTALGPRVVGTGWIFSMEIVVSWRISVHVIPF